MLIVIEGDICSPLESLPSFLVVVYPYLSEDLDKGRVGCYHEYKATFKTWLLWELQIKVMFVVSGGSR